MAGEFRVLTYEEREICRENGVDPEGKVVILRNDTGLHMLHHKTRDEVYIYFGDARLRKNKEVKHGNQ